MRLFFNQLSSLIFCSVASTSNANTYYVAPTSTDLDAQDRSGYGTSRDTPFETARYAAKQSVAGDEIILLDGDYFNTDFRDDNIWKNGNTMWIKDLRGTAEHPVVIRADNIENHQILGDASGIFQCRGCAHVIVRDLNIVGEVENIPLEEATENRFLYKLNDGTDTIYQRMDPSWTPEQIDQWFDDGNELDLLDTSRPSKYNTVGLLIHSSWNVDVENCRVGYVPGTGLRIQNSDYVTVKKCTVQNSSRRSSQGTNGIVVNTGVNNISGATVYDSGYRFQFLANTIYDNYNEVYSWVDTKTYVHPYIDEGKGMSAEHVNNKHWETGRILMANNIAYGNGLSGINSNNSDRIDMFHNTAYQNIRTGRGVNAGISCNDSKSCNVKNNISISVNDYGGFAYNARFDDLGADEIVFEDNIAVGQVKPTLPAQIMVEDINVLFINIMDNAGDLNFDLKKCSPAVDVGGSILDTPIDFDGKTRDETPDLGALEYDGPSCEGNHDQTFSPSFAPSAMPTSSPTPTGSPTVLPSHAPTDAPTSVPSDAPSDAPIEPPTGCVPKLVKSDSNCTKPLTFDECGEAADELGYKWIPNAINSERMDKPFDHLPGGCFAKKNKMDKIIKMRYNSNNDPGTNCGQDTKGGKFTKLCVCCA